MISANVIINNTEWLRYIKNPKIYLQRNSLKISKKDKIFSKKKFSFTLLLSNNKEIRTLNKKFRNKNKSTDILSFPFHNKLELKKVIKKNKEIYLGDIILNLDKLKKKRGKSFFLNEFNKLWIHGFVHLFGYDHKKIKDYYIMSLAEKRFLSYL